MTFVQLVYEGSRNEVTVSSSVTPIITRKINENVTNTSIDTVRKRQRPSELHTHFLQGSRKKVLNTIAQIDGGTLAICKFGTAEVDISTWDALRV